jgi:hypothetical protein
MVALAINYACCCSHCCSPEDNPNNVPDIQIEMNSTLNEVVTV